MYSLSPLLATGSTYHSLLHFTILLTLGGMHKPRSASLRTSKEEPVEINAELRIRINTETPFATRIPIP
jgi:hypothetical protein